MIVGVHIIILYASEREIAAEVKASPASGGRICSQGCKEKHLLSRKNVAIKLALTVYCS